MDAETSKIIANELLRASLIPLGVALLLVITRELLLND